MLKFNIEKHKLNELEKYGFVEKGSCYALNIYHLNYNDSHPSYIDKEISISIVKDIMQVLFIYSYKLKDTEESKNNIVKNGIVEYETNLEILYDLIKDGLIVKE